MTASQPTPRNEPEDTPSEARLPRRTGSAGAQGRSPDPVPGDRRAPGGGPASLSELLAAVREREQGPEPQEDPEPGEERTGSKQHISPDGPPGGKDQVAREARSAVAPLGGADSVHRSRRPGRGVLTGAAVVGVVAAATLPFLLTGGDDGKGAAVTEAPGAVVDGSRRADPQDPAEVGAPVRRAPGAASSESPRGRHATGTPGIPGRPPAAKPPGTGTGTVTGTGTEREDTSAGDTVVPPPTGPAPGGSGSAGSGATPAVSIRSYAADRCIDVPGDFGRPDGTQLQLWDCTGADWQLWQFRSDDTLRSLGKCLDVAGSSAADGAKILWTTCNGRASQRFRLNAAHDLVNLKADKCVDAKDEQAANGTLLQLWACNGQSNQKWRSA